MRSPAGSARSARRPLAVALAASFALVGLTAPLAQADTSLADADLLVAYDFSDTTGTSIPDSSGNGNTGTIVGTGATVAGEVLSLPGGASNSNAGHVRFPAGTFDNRNTLTISSWLKNDMPASNFAAMFFGTTQSLPSSYWLLNTRTPGNRYKSVFTNAVNASAPWSTEVGVSDNNGAQTVQGPAATNEWALYTTVIEPTKITVYLNEAKVGEMALTRTVSQFGTGLVGYIGRSSYADPFFKGSVRDVAIYTDALSPAAVAERYWATADAATITSALTSDRDALSIVPSVVTQNLTLPTTGTRGSAITWASSAPGTIAADGTVTRPSGPDATVTLTATLTLAGQTTTRTFTLTVPSANPQGDLDRLAQRYALRPTLVAGTELPELGLGTTTAITTTSPQVTVTGRTVTTTATAAVPATLTATFTQGSLTSVRTFDVEILPEAAADYVLGYERTPLSTNVYGPKVAYSLHLGSGDTLGSITALNGNQGVLYAKAAPTGTLDLLDVRTLRDPYVFETEDGYGVVATRSLANGTPDATATSSVLLFTSPDLKDYTEVGLLDLGVTHGVRDARVVWDANAELYRVTWTNPAGTPFSTTLTDLADASTRGPVSAGALVLAETPVTTTITGAVPTTLLAVPKDVTTSLAGRFGRIVNTSVDVADQTIAEGDALDLSDVEATLGYNDGSTATRPVDWDAADLAAVDTSVPGTYQVSGTVRQRTYAAPFINAEADPNILKYGDSYLFISTDDTNVVGATRMYLRQADTIEGLRTAPDHVVATTGGPTDIRGCFWAPELHEIDGTLYVFFAPCIGSAVWNRVQAHVIELAEGGDPTVQADWSTPRLVTKADGGLLQVDAGHPGISLDMTHWEDAGTHYVAWSQRYTSPGMGDAETWVATVDPSDPSVLTSEPRKLISSEYGWDMNTSNVNEGGFVVKHGDQLYLTYSGSNIDATYTVGMLRATSGDDLTDPASWHKFNAPALATDTSISQYGPGHNAFTVDEDGNTVLVYHAKSSESSYRHTYLRTVHFSAEGIPQLDMTPNELVAPANATVTLTVTVEADVPAISFVDVPPGVQFYDEITWLAGQGVTTGWELPDGSREFRPVTPVKRDAMAAFLYRLAGSPAFTAPTTSPFTDVPTTNQFSKEISWLAAEGISTGWAQPDGSKRFEPLSDVGRDAMAVFLYRYADVTGYTAPATSAFVDVPTSNMFYKEISWLASEGISTGYPLAGGAKEFRPLGSVNRDAMAAFMYRLSHLG